MRLFGRFFGRFVVRIRREGVEEIVGEIAGVAAPRRKCPADALPNLLLLLLLVAVQRQVRDAAEDRELLLLVLRLGRLGVSLFPEPIQILTGPRLLAPLHQRGQRRHVKLGAAGQVHHLHERPGALLEPANLGAHHREVLPRLPRRRHLLHRLSERDVRGGKLLSPDVQRGYVVPSLPILRIHLRAPDEGAEGFLLAIRLEQGVAAAEPSVGEERVGLHRLGPVLSRGFPILAERGSPGQRPHGARVLALAHLERL